MIEKKQNIDNDYINSVISILLNCSSIIEIFDRIGQLFEKYLNPIEYSIFYFNKVNKITFNDLLIPKSTLDDKIKYFEEQGIIDWLISTKTTSILDDPDNAINSGLTKIVVVPIFHKNIIFSLIVISTNDENEVIMKEMDKINSISNIISLIIYNYMLVDINSMYNDQIHSLNERFLKDSVIQGISSININFSDDIDSALKIISSNLNLIENEIGNPRTRVNLIKKQIDLIQNMNSQMKKLNLANDSLPEKTDLIKILNNSVKFCESELFKNNIIIKPIENIQNFENITYTFENEIERLLVIIFFGIKDLLADDGEIAIHLTKEKEKFFVINIIVTGLLKNIDVLKSSTNLSVDEQNIEFSNFIYAQNIAKKINGRISILTDDYKSLTVKILIPIINPEI